MWYVDDDGYILINGSFKQNIDNIIKHYELLEKENKMLREQVKALEADKMNDERVKELTERVEYLELNGWCLWPEDRAEYLKKVEKFKQEHPQVDFELIWNCGWCHLGKVMTCYAQYKENGTKHKEEIYAACY